jgi:hypothetical protein
LLIDPALEQKLALVKAIFIDPAPHSLAGQLGDLEQNRPAGLSLHDGGSGPYPPIEGHIIDSERDKVTDAQLAVEG